MNFKELHQQENPLLIGNIWDAKSAQLFESLKFQAIGTSSAAIAHLLGYEDGENMPFPDLVFMVKRILANTNLPLSVDLEGGYSRVPEKIADHIEQIFDLGVVGINLEDSIVKNGRRLLPTEDFANIIAEIKNELGKRNISIFMNIRTDTFLLKLPNVLEATLARIATYAQVGADGIFVPCIENEVDITSVVQSTHLPINVMCMPHLPDFEKLKTLGVKRISMGNYLHNFIYDQLGKVVTSGILKHQSFKPIFAPKPLPY